MFFRRHHDGRRKTGFGPLAIFRVLLSLMMMGLLALGFYQAYKTFSGVDPLKLDPKSLLTNSLNSDGLSQALVKLLSFNPGLPISKPKIISQENLHSKSPSQNPSISVLSVSQQSSYHPTPVPITKPVSYKFALIADSENDNDHLKKALTEAKAQGAKFVIGLGDWTQVGTVKELTDTKLQFDSGLTYYLIPGDHDLWDSRNQNQPPIKNFKAVFGSNYQSFAFMNGKFILIDNSDNYDGVGDVEQQWIHDELSKSRQDSHKLLFVFTSTPLFHPSSDHVMGKVEPKLKFQADTLINDLKAANVSEVFSGDTHFYSRYVEPRTNLMMTAVGAITSDRNLQLPRYVMVDVYTDDSYNVEDLEVK